MQEYLVKNEAGLRDAAEWFLENMRGAKIFAFSGEMGAGKTTLIKAICRALNVGQVVSSPSFALVYEYISPEAGTIYHFDLYRIEDISELYDLGYEDYFYNDSICFIEWPEVAEDLLPPGTVHVRIEVNPDLSRKIFLNA